MALFGPARLALTEMENGGPGSLSFRRASTGVGASAGVGVAHRTGAWVGVSVGVLVGTAASVAVGVGVRAGVRVGLGVREGVKVG
jgi:NF-X1-type zinc finger protein NFXL1